MVVVVLLLLLLLLLQGEVVIRMHGSATGGYTTGWDTCEQNGSAIGSTMTVCEGGCVC